MGTATGGVATGAWFACGDSDWRGCYRGLVYLWGQQLEGLLQGLGLLVGTVTGGVATGPWFACGDSDWNRN